MVRRMKIRSLFQKAICSLCTIINICNDKEIKREAKKYLGDLVGQYYQYINYKNVYKLNFKYSFADISDFMYECIDYQKEDLMWIAEDMFYGFDELMDTILEEKKTRIFRLNAGL